MAAAPYFPGDYFPGDYFPGDYFAGGGAVAELSLSGALKAVVPILGGLSVSFTHVQANNANITVERNVQKVFGLPPDEGVSLEELCPCWVNTWTFGTDLRGLGLGVTDYDFTMSLYVGKGPETELLTDIATHFHDALMTALRQNLRLVDADGDIQATNEAKIRGDNPTLCVMYHGREPYIGLRYHLAFDQWQDTSFG